MKIKIVPIPAYQDNYIWILHDDENAVVVDPGLAAPVEDYLTRHQLNLTDILITHHHWDHVNGMEELQNHWDCPVYAPDDSRIPGRLTLVEEGQSVALKKLKIKLQVIATPGHTLSHICYFNQQWLFCGDTLFSMGCGRMFEGEPAQFVNSLNKIKALSPETWVYCAHEYTLNNLDFAQSIEPDNAAIEAKKEKVLALRHKDQPSVPVKLGSELALNPFLKTDQTAIQTALEHKFKTQINDEVSCFALLRKCKDEF